MEVEDVCVGMLQEAAAGDVDLGRGERTEDARASAILATGTEESDALLPSGTSGRSTELVEDAELRAAKMQNERVAAVGRKKGGSRWRLGLQGWMPGRF